MPGARHEPLKAKKKEGGHPARLVRCCGLEARAIEWKRLDFYPALDV